MQVSLKRLFEKLFTKINPRRPPPPKKKNPTNPEKYKKSKDFFEDLKFVHLI